MSHSVQMPALGESVTEGTVTRWLKREGDTVVEDEPLLEVSTDKVDTEVPAPYGGVLEKILVQEDETVAIGAALAIIGDGSGGTDHAAAPASEPAPVTYPAAAPVAAPPVAAAAPGAEPESSPALAPLAVEEAAMPMTAAAPAPAAPAASATAGPGATVTMPAMGESVTEGTITRWLKSVGDAIAEDEPIVEISTDKVDAEVPSPVAGVLLQILAAEDATVEVGSPIAVVGVAAGAGGGAADQAPAPGPAAAAAPTEVAETSAVTAPSPVMAAAPAPGAVPNAQPHSAPAPVAAAPAAPTAGHNGYVTPVVRKLAADHGVDLATVTGSGVGGRIRREDVLAAASSVQTSATPQPVPVVSMDDAAALYAPPAAAPTTTAGAPVTAAAPPAAAPAAQPTAPVSLAPARAGAALVGTTQPAPRIRQAMARSVMHALANSAQTSTIIEVDVSRIAALRSRVEDAFRSREGIELTLTPFFVKAAIEAAKTHPIVNASLSDDLTSITYHAAVHLGISVNTDRGQAVPVIHRADDLNVTGLARHMADLTDRTIRGALAPDELSGATISITELSTPGTLIDMPIVVPPQAAMLALGAVAKRPVVVSDADGNDVIAVRSIATIAVSYDQRFVDSADVARFLATFKARIESGDFTADLGI